MTSPRWRSALFWIHLVAGLLAGIAVVPMAVTGAMLAFASEIQAWSDAPLAVRASNEARLPPSELLARATRLLPPNVKPDTLEIERDPAAAARLETDTETWLVDPYDGRVLGVSSASRIIDAAAEVHFTVGLGFVGLSTLGSWLAGGVAVSMAVLSLSGPWLWWPRKLTSGQLRRRIWFSRSQTSAARDFAWHHVIGIWSMPMILAASLTGTALRFEAVRNAIGAVMGRSADPELALDGDAAVRELEARAPGWSAIRLVWPEGGGLIARVRLGRGTAPTEWAALATVVDAAGGREVVLRRYADGRTGDKLLGWGRWLHTGQALGRVGQAIWLTGAIGILWLAWTGLALSLRRWRRFRREARVG